MRVSFSIFVVLSFKDRVLVSDQVDCSDEEMYSKLSKQQAIASNMGVIDQELLLAELVKDIANELDNRLLCHKILQHLCALINADRALLYLVEGDKKSDRNYLVNALYDVTRGVDNGVSNEEDVESKSGRYLRVPIGVGVIGTVAKCRELINIQDVNEVNAPFYSISSNFLFLLVTVR